MTTRAVPPAQGSSIRSSMRVAGAAALLAIELADLHRLAAAMGLAPVVLLERRLAAEPDPIVRDEALREYSALVPWIDEYLRLLSATGRLNGYVERVARPPRSRATHGQRIEPCVTFTAAQAGIEHRMAGLWRLACEDARRQHRSSISHLGREAMASVPPARGDARREAAAVSEMRFFLGREKSRLTAALAYQTAGGRASRQSVQWLTRTCHLGH